MSEPVNLAVFLIVVVSRLAVPLLIPRWPLPGVIAALILDGIDGGIFEKFATQPFKNYQTYDKALDIYYLTIAYLSTMRNWTNWDAINVSRFLFYYRLAGVVLFEWTQYRWLMLIVPNTFEYFFIFYEIVRLRWNPARMSRQFVIGAAAAIWIVIKLPQEYWIHIAQRDLSDTILENPILIPILAGLAVILLAIVRWLLKDVFPPADQPLSIEAESAIPHERIASTLRQYRSAGLIAQRLPEKVVLVTLVSVIFAQILPDIRVRSLALMIGVAIVIVANTAITEWLSHRGSIWKGTIWQFLVMAVINFGIVWALIFLTPGRDETMILGSTIFILFLVSLLITLFDLFASIFQTRERMRIIS